MSWWWAIFFSLGGAMAGCGLGIGIIIFVAYRYRHGEVDDG